MNKKRTILILLAVLILLLIAFPFLLSMGTGSKSYANEWSENFLNVKNIEEAKDKLSDISHRKFENGDWIFGTCSDSHSSPWGGTIVVKDSNGETRCFFGHVCGAGFLQRILLVSESLDDIYQDKLQTFSEYKQD